MSSDGKQLEFLVAFVESELLPAGFTVLKNERVFNDEGVQVAEFDIEIRGKVGSTTIAWLIECRDRPGQGSAPGSWIEQLAGRRLRFGFNKVTAVSTTGFSPSAADFAKQQGIETREVRSLDPSEFADWLQISSLRQVRKITKLLHADIFLNPHAAEDIKAAALQAISNASGNDALLRSSSTGVSANLSQAFFAAVQSVPDAFENVSEEHPVDVELNSTYQDDDHFLLDSVLGTIRVQSIRFQGELRIEVTTVPLVKTAEYRHAESGELVSQLAAFAPQEILGMKLAVELHRMASTGGTHLTMRRLADDA
jgi:hypothetical protein